MLPSVTEFSVWTKEAPHKVKITVINRQSHSSYMTSGVVPSHYSHYIRNRKEPQRQRWLCSTSASTGVLSMWGSPFWNKALQCELQLNKAGTEIYFHIHLKCCTRRFFSTVASSLRIKLISLQYNKEFRNFRFLHNNKTAP